MSSRTTDDGRQLNKASAADKKRPCAAPRCCMALYIYIFEHVIGLTQRRRSLVLLDSAHYFARLSLQLFPVKLCDDAADFRRGMESFANSRRLSAESMYATWIHLHPSWGLTSGFFGFHFPPYSLCSFFLPIPL